MVGRYEHQSMLVSTGLFILAWSEYNLQLGSLVETIATSWLGKVVTTSWQLEGGIYANIYDWREDCLNQCDEVAPMCWASTNGLTTGTNVLTAGPNINYWPQWADCSLHFGALGEPRFSEAVADWSHRPGASKPESRASRAPQIRPPLKVKPKPGQSNFSITHKIT
jgi:hypothetical protein